MKSYLSLLTFLCCVTWVWSLTQDELNVLDLHKDNITRTQGQRRMNGFIRSIYHFDSKAFPNYTTKYYDTLGRETTFKMDIMVDPVRAETPSCLHSGPIAMAINGVPIFRPYTSRGLNALEVEYTHFDGCHGHNSPPPQLRYHYHSIPVCFIDREKVDQFIGVAMDGYPIYGPYDKNGPVTNKNLDRCGGRVESVNGKRVYGYRMTYEFPYSLGCFTGTVVTDKAASDTKCLFTKDCGPNPGKYVKEDGDIYDRCGGGQWEGPPGKGQDSHEDNTNSESQDKEDVSIEESDKMGKLPSTQKEGMRKSDKKGKFGDLEVINKALNDKKFSDMMSDKMPEWSQYKDTIDADFVKQMNEGKMDMEEGLRYYQKLVQKVKEEEEKAGVDPEKQENKEGKNQEQQQEFLTEAEKAAMAAEKEKAVMAAQGAKEAIKSEKEAKHAAAEEEMAAMKAELEAAKAAGKEAEEAARKEAEEAARKEAEEAAKTAGKEAEEAAKAARKKAEEAAKAAGNETEKAAKAAGNETEKAAKAAGKEAEEAAKAAEKQAEEAAKAAEKEAAAKAAEKEAAAKAAEKEAKAARKEAKKAQKAAKAAKKAKLNEEKDQNEQQEFLTEAEKAAMAAEEEAKKAQKAEKAKLKEEKAKRKQELKLKKEQRMKKKQDKKNKDGGK